MDGKVQLTRKQVNFITDMTGINDPQLALNRFTQIMREEGISHMDVIKVINTIMERMGK